ncbi:unnamed protein product [Larinioides sclopetarius]|uniref:Uncharacterized protein n=1 Tax=Larinioides sclopetarius TaxID=280406 RepID=A0AAV2BAN7_9ARAC
MLAKIKDVTNIWQLFSIRNHSRRGLRGALPRLPFDHA